MLFFLFIIYDVYICISIRILIVLSVLIDGASIIPMIVGGASLILLLTISNFWYGLSRYPSIWNSFVPVGVKGNNFHENFAEIREICSFYCNGDDRTNSQLVASLITLPFTTIFHLNSFLVTYAYYQLNIENKGAKLPRSVTTSIFLSNTLVALVWFFGGRTGIVFATATEFFNRKLYNSLLFQKSFKEFCFSLLFGNLLVIQKTKAATLTTNHEMTTFPEESDGKMQFKTKQMDTKVDTRHLRLPRPTINRPLPPLLAESSSSSSSMSYMIENSGERTKYSSFGPRKNQKSSVIKNKTRSDWSNNVDLINQHVGTLDNNEPLAIGNTTVTTGIRSNTELCKISSQSVSEELDSVKSVDELKFLVTIIPNNIAIEQIPEKAKQYSPSFNNNNVSQKNSTMSTSIDGTHTKLEEQLYSPKRRRRRYFNISSKNHCDTNKPLCSTHGKNEDEKLDSSRMRRSSRKKRFSYSRKISFQRTENPLQIDVKENESDAELSEEFLNPTDVHVDIEDHPGTVVWKNIISESVQWFRIDSYTPRKHNWIMNQMQNRAFFVKEDRQRRRKLKRKEIKERSKLFHNKQLRLRHHIFGILDDLSDLQKSHNNSKSNSDHTRKSIVDITPLEMNENDNRNRNHKNDQQKSTVDALSSAIDSHVESSKDSTISTLTQSVEASVKSEIIRNTQWVTGPTGEKSRETNKKKDIDGSANFSRSAINGLLEYTSWLDNLNPLKELDSSPKGLMPENNDGRVIIMHEAPSYKNRRNADAKIPVEIIDGRNDRNSERLDKEAYWRNLVDEKKIVKPSFNANKNKEKLNSKQNVLHLNGNTENSASSSYSRSRELRKLYPIWKNSLQFQKSMKKLRRQRRNSEIKANSYLVKVVDR